MTNNKNYFPDDPLWFKEAIIYELNIKSFYDSNGDGIGDIRGLIEKLDYLKDLGITAIWLLPFYPSPLKDDGYDISDYINVHPSYGTLHDFKDLVLQAHEHGIRVIIELVLNHTSDQHPWFQRARISEPNSAYRNYYVWGKTPERYPDARIIFKDFETSNWSWDPIAKEYYWHRFYAHQPDLNYDNPAVVKEMLSIIDFWMKFGIDGIRLDAVPYLYERDNTNCENLPETHAFLKNIRSFIDKKYKGRMLLAEANQWPEDAAKYFGTGDECHMAFNFPVMPRMFMSIWMEDSYPTRDIIEQTPAIPENCQWALFLRNHDELTLEMVTDEERDYMYQVYAKDPNAKINLGIRRRLAPLLGNNRRKIELMNFLLFSLQGTPVIYYGDEIGMGDNFYLGDRNGVRTPMQWSGERNAGFSHANPQKLYLPPIIDPEYHYETVNAENMQKNQSSLLWWMKRVIAMRRRFKSFSKGSIEFVPSNNSKTLSFIQTNEDEHILVVLNLSRFSQSLELDLSKYKGYLLREIFSRNKFPRIGDSPYVFTLGFYDYFWFELKKDDKDKLTERLIPEITFNGAMEKFLEDENSEDLTREILPEYLMKCRWFRGKTKTIQSLKIAENIKTGGSNILLLDVLYTEGLSETYLLPVGFASGADMGKVVLTKPASVILKLKNDGSESVLFENSWTEEFQKMLLGMILKKQVFRGDKGLLSAHQTKLLKTFSIGLQEKLQPVSVEQSNTSFMYGENLYMKLYRELKTGMNPEVEIIKFLTEKSSFKNIPPFLGGIDYVADGSKKFVAGVLLGSVKNQGDAWAYTANNLSRYYEKVLADKGKSGAGSAETSVDMAGQEAGTAVQGLIGIDYIEMVKLLAKRTAEMHLALFNSGDDPDFAPEPFSQLYQRALFQSIHQLAKRSFDLIRKSQKSLAEKLRQPVCETLELEKEIQKMLNGLLNRKISMMKIRIHGDYHLGQVLFTGNDFYIIDFEGEPMRTLSERRLKKSAMKDLAGMLRSFNYAAYTSLFTSTLISRENKEEMERWAQVWYKEVSEIFLKAYLDIVGKTPLIPWDRDTFESMLDIYLLEKVLYEIDYELNNRPDWLEIPLKGIKNILK